MIDEINSNINEEITIAVCGPVDAGKSTIIGVLTSGELDNGKGLARNKVLIHPHEIESGRTSNITFNPLIYSICNNKLSHYIFGESKGKKNSIIKKEEIDIYDEKSEKTTSKSVVRKRIVSFLDLAGHEKYLRTTVFGVSGLFPNYGLIIIGSNTGITKLTREHIGILYYLNIPFIICITKIDLAPRHVYQQLCNKIKKLLGSKVYQKVSYFISDSDKKDQETNKFLNEFIHNIDAVPIISISNKDGTNIKNLHKIISNIKIKSKWENKCTDDNSLEKGSIVYIDNNYQVPGIGLVVSGSVKGKSIKVKDKMYIGPCNGIFYQVIVRSIHNTISQIISEAHNESQSCFAIKYTNPKNVIERNDIKKGMVLIDNLDIWKKNVVKSFKAKITVLQHSTTIKDGYSPVIHCGPIRQAARLSFIKSEKESSIFSEDIHIRSGDSKEVIFTFSQHSEFMESDKTFFFMDGNTKGVGKVISLIDY